MLIQKMGTDMEREGDKIHKKAQYKNWRIPHNEELHNLCSSPNTYNYNDDVKKNAMGKACSRHGEQECTYCFDSNARRKEDTRKAYK
jgi:hypothetical protein